jgi:hypothetical protein
MGCSESFLETVNPNTTSKENFWKTKNDAVAGIYGVYSVLQQTSLYGWDYRNFEAVSDNGFNEFVGEGYLAISEGTHLTTNVKITTFYQGNYTVINRSNEVLANVPGMEIDDATKNTIIGEAYFLRALAYLNLTTLYGNVPLILEPVSFGSPYFPNNPREDTRDRMIRDLTEAISLLPESNPGRVTKGAASALLAKYYLYGKDWSNAAQTALNVMGMGYQLHPNYHELFTVAGEKSKEVIFSVIFQSQVGGEGERFSGGYAVTPQPEIRPLPELVDDYEMIDGLPITESPLYDPVNPYNNRDPRLDYSILRPGDTWLGKPYDFADSDTKYCVYKYIRETTALLDDGPQDFYVIRYGDILLMYAEAKNELSGPDQSVYNAINAVRNRVGMPNIQSGLSKDAMREVIRHERRIELALEGLRLYDLMRWGIAKEAYEKIKFHNRTYISPKHDLFPIPQLEMDNNPLIVQNPGW